MVDVCKPVLSSENQYITLCPASSRFVTEISKKIGRDKFVKVLFTWHADEKGSTFIFGSLFVHTNRVIEEHQDPADQCHFFIATKGVTI